MRIFVSCNQCKHRYRATNRKVGTKFRCHCGEVLQVRQPWGHTASVMRCSFCAGTRERNSRHCGYCGADFTLYERDLNTVCPNCFARVSDRTRYCPQYAELLSGQSVAGEDSRFVCPMCPNDEKLASRQLGKENLNILECQYCTGLWIGIDSFSELRDRVAEDATSPVKILLGQLKPRKLRPHAGTMYRKCIQCDKIMIRRQCAKRSGVIVGVCGHHGI